MKTFKSMAVVSLALVCLPVARADTLVEPASATAFEKRPSSEGKTFVCLGAGLRKYLFVKVYAMDFCIEEGSAKAGLDGYFAGPGKQLATLRGKQLASALEKDPAFFGYLAWMVGEKRAEIVFLRKSDADSVRGAFAKNLEKVLGAGEQAAIRNFASAIDRDINAGDRAVFSTLARGELVLVWGKSARSLKRPKVEELFWQVYLGPDSPLPSLKESIAEGVARLRQ